MSRVLHFHAAEFTGKTFDELAEKGEVFAAPVSAETVRLEFTIEREPRPILGREDKEVASVFNLGNPAEAA
jgi:hypothetical protein